MSGGPQEPIDLGTVRAHPVPGTPSVPRERDLVTLLGGVRHGAGEMARDIRAAHRGPKANTRDVPDWVRSLAWVLDEAIPLPGGHRVGIDGVMSFIPGIGDVAGLTAGMVVVLTGIGAGVSMPTVALMMVNMAIEGIIGAIPFLGALFDMAYKSNTRNLRLIEADLQDRAGSRRSAMRVLGLGALAIFLWMLLIVVVFVGSIALFVMVLNRIF